jgi:hypothetical protein
MIKIEKITIKGFKKIKQAEVELSPNCNLFLGHNETGKTSLEDAITYALTDSIQGQPKGTFIEVINDQYKTTSVAITGQVGDIPFSIKRTLAKISRSGPSPVQVGAQLGIDPVILSACLNANYYFDLPLADQKKLIIKALGLKPTRKDAVDALAKVGEFAGTSWNDTIIQEIESLGWDAGYKEAYKLRRETGQEIKILKGEQPKLITEISLEGKDVPMDVIMATHKKESLEKQETKHKTRLKQLHEELGGIKALSEADKQVAEADLERYKAEKADIAKKVKWTGEDTAKAKQLKVAKKKFDIGVKESVNNFESLANDAKDSLAQNKNNWESDLACPIADESGHKMCPAVEPDWSEQQKEIDGIAARILAIKEKEFPAQEQWDDLSKKATECKDNIAQDKVLALQIKELEKTLEDAAPEAGEKKEALEISIDALEKKVEHLRSAQSAIIWNQATQETLDATQVKIEETETKREHYNSLCELLSPVGIPGELVAKKLGGLNTRLKKHSKMMGVSIQFLDDLSLVCGDKKQLWVLGGAETSRVRMAVAEALSFVTGVGLLLLDELNVSVAQDSARVRAWLVDIGQTTQIVAAAATNALAPPTVPENSPVRMFWAEDGSIKRL